MNEQNQGLELFDFEFFLFIGTYINTSELIAIHILDMLAKIYFNDLVYAHVTLLYVKINKI